MKKRKRNFPVTRARERYIARLLLTGLTKKEVAKRLGLPIPTVYNLTQRQTFKDAATVLENDIYGAGDRLLATTYLKAVKRLMTIIDKADAKSAIRGIREAFKITGRVKPTVHKTIERGIEESYSSAQNTEQKSLSAGDNVVPISLPASAVKAAKRYLRETRHIFEGNYPRAGADGDSGNG